MTQYMVGSHNYAMQAAQQQYGMFAGQQAVSQDAMAQSPIPNPQSPIPNPQSPWGLGPIPISFFKKLLNLNIYIYLIINKKNILINFYFTLFGIYTLYYYSL